jgi:hypothetical protein
MFPGADNTFELYEDDGETSRYLQGEYALTPFTFYKGVFTIQAARGDLSVMPAQRVYRIHLRGVDSEVAASAPAAYDPTTRTLTLDAITLAPHQAFSVTFTGI